MLKRKLDMLEQEEQPSSSELSPPLPPLSSSSTSNRPSPRRELQLQGPRPTPLKVTKDSHKIKKPPIPPQHNRPPVIIYTVSPKVIHTNPCDFMSLVQRLTGPSPRPNSSNHPGSISPAARFASIEKTRNASEDEFQNQRSRTVIPAPASGSSYDHIVNLEEDEQQQEEMMMMMMNNSSSNSHHHHHHHHHPAPAGILSPHPSTLPTISPNFFSSLPDPNSFNFLFDFSPIGNSKNNNFIEGTYVPSPSANAFFSSSPNITSPTLSFDLFNQFFDF